MADHKIIDVLGIGELNPDRVLSGIAADGPVIGTEQAFAQEDMVLGSSTAIACVLMQRLGLKTALSASVGDDSAGAFCLEALRREGVDCDPVVIDPDQATGVTYSITYPTDRMLLTRLGTMGTFAADDVDQGWISRARHVHSGSFFILGALRPGLPGLFASAKAAGATTSVDFGWDITGTWDRDALASVLPHTDVVFPNQDELAAVTGCAETEDGIANLHRMGAREVVVKLGSEGSLVSVDGTIVRHAGFAVDPVDTTGAGDALNAGYMFARLAGWPLEDRLRLGNACGAVTVSSVGGTGGLQTLDAVRALITAAGQSLPAA